MTAVIRAIVGRVGIVDGCDIHMSKRQ